MKKFLIALMFLVPVTTLQVTAKPATQIAGNPVIGAITKALNNSDAETLSQYFGTKVQVSIDNNEQTLDKSKAKEALLQFFSQKNASGYSAMHSGKSKENNDHYMIGNLTTKAGTYRVYIYLKTIGTSQIIQEMRFDK